MNIYTVADNLRNTIKGKEAMLASLKVKDEVGQYTLRYMLDLNIQELKVILFDVEQCCEQYNLMSWEINPERMGQ
jgi:hypothetical protein